MLAGRTELAASARRIGRLWHLRTFVLLLTPLFIGFQATRPTPARVVVLLSAKVDVYDSAVSGLEQTLLASGTRRGIRKFTRVEL